ncbi:hypothetical protein PHJA_001120600 [Phtheirospermum japonicum]|uniref:Uncharacterized protein n=1 Tax=Phtheirospermum japonicum TaxID=374723 RepID=A0A830BXR4_9LAMI|nr:hypothetical protein PHJA_001120600 [Phtheirospermum japonicum]
MIRNTIPRKTFAWHVDTYKNTEVKDVSMLRASRLRLTSHAPGVHPSNHAGTSLRRTQFTIKALEEKRKFNMASEKFYKLVVSDAEEILIGADPHPLWIYRLTVVNCTPLDPNANWSTHIFEAQPGLDPEKHRQVCEAIFRTIKFYAAAPRPPRFLFIKRWATTCAMLAAAFSIGWSIEDRQRLALSGPRGPSSALEASGAPAVKPIARKRLCFNIGNVAIEIEIASMEKIRNAVVCGIGMIASAVLKTKLGI